MLKALELVGFKSFADKTRLEFPRGITVVVGPNGSGKSNIVDAIKWVLGEQSVKTLRGKEMADVIFNGSSTRRALNAAETTLTLDNSAKLLAIDTPEVHITRRVYRSGEGEYLINRQPCRLRDIRDLFAGTGVATEAYSVIEQGKVDILLQSSPRERRLIFEEAAGISRFKAKKLESIRRLERVEQNLLRLSDIVDEVESRLRSVRLQASKARRYQEYSDRLQALRTQISSSDWRKLTSQLSALESELAAIQGENVSSLAHVESLELECQELERQVAAADTAARASEGTTTGNRERIAALESTIAQQRRRSHDLEEEAARYRRVSTSMSVRADDLERQLRQISEGLTEAEREHREATSQLAEHERNLTRLTAQADEQISENERSRSAHLERLRAASTLGNQISALESSVASTRAQRDHNRKRLTELTAAAGVLSAEVDQSRAKAAELAQACVARQGELQAMQTQLDTDRRDAAALAQQLGQLRERHSAASERAGLLEELERRLEGLSAGVKQVLTQAQSSTSGPFGQIRGLVADLLHVNFETAQLIEIALGEMAQCVVVAGGRELLAHLQGAASLAGRVGFIRLDVVPPKNHLDQLDLQGNPGVLGRADRFVETAPEHAILARRLLGRTWIVENLGVAAALSESIGRGLCFVTRAGELLEADGTLYAGPRNTSTGLISRRSELRVLRQQTAQMATQVETRQRTLAQIETRIAAADELFRKSSAEYERSGEAWSRERSRAAAAAERQEQLNRQLADVENEMAEAGLEHERATAALAESQARSAGISDAVAELERRIAEGAARTAEIDQARQRSSREAGAMKIQVVKTEQRLSHLETQRGQLERDQLERGRALVDSRAQLAACLEKLRQSEREILQGESELAELYLRKESFSTVALRRAAERDEWHAQKAKLAADALRIRARIRKLESRLHAKELAAGEVRHERTTLEDRLREDYGIELAELEHQPAPEELSERTAVDREIMDLRGKLNSIGGVNLEALAELEELETRHQNLSGQFNDLTAAKVALAEIIDKINADSRRLFADTLEVVRGHFQSLFRKLFGGGQADIVLDEGIDILDSGIEIVARPPGKEPRNISLLSGGEKTLTCVALLLAIFRSRPSPFCVLDEVDAALDEANIERFIGVLQEFLAWTQFIVVTHSKKTMTCANTLYGVTMQESGVSKRVSVRFDDVSDNGEILDVREGPHPVAGDETQAA